MTRVKICGITELEDALKAVEYGADALGFVFFDKSPRNISPQTAALIASELPPFVTTVGVFVNESPDRIRAISDEVRLSCVQLHGDESPEFCASLGLKVIKALRVKNKADINMLRAYSVSAYLLDTYKAGVPGGTGETFDWEIAVEAKKLGRIILSGGLNPENIKDAIELVRPYAVDVSSGVEIKPGKKDPDKVLKFIQRVKRP